MDFFKVVMVEVIQLLRYGSLWSLLRLAKFSAISSMTIFSPVISIYYYHCDDYIITPLPPTPFFLTMPRPPVTSMLFFLSQSPRLLRLPSF